MRTKREAPRPVRSRHPYRPDLSVRDWRGRSTVCVCGYPFGNVRHDVDTPAGPAVPVGPDYAQRAAGDYEPDG